MIGVLATISFVLSPSARTFLPMQWNAFIDSHALKLGIDLAGGTKLEYQVDFTKAVEKAKLAGKTESEMVDKKQISEGVVKTLKKRIDPDGTKEVSIFASQRGEEWFVVVELTKDVDTPENRAKLEKVTSLSFREPYTSEAEASASAQILLDGVIAQKTSFEDLSVYLMSGGEGVPYTAENGFSKEVLEQKIGTQNAKALWNAEASGWYPKVLENDGKQFFFYIATPVANNILMGSLLEYSGKWKETQLGGSQFSVAKVGTDPNTNYPVTNIEFTLEGAALFGQITGELAKRTNTRCGPTGDVFAIFVDNKMVSDPCVREKISGNAQISFGKTSGSSFQQVQEEAQALAESLNSGATPAPINLIAEQTISATLGESALALSFKAFILGFAVLALWMIASYRYLGFLAVLALIFYSIAILVIFRLTGFVLTLPGIAGVILSVGMAVDANILIFERTREELKEGKGFTESISEGFDRAWTSIRDSNTSSLITCFILWAVGTSIIKAFAITLATGILLSLFTAIVVTRYLIWTMVPKSVQKKQSFLLGGK